MTSDEATYDVFFSYSHDDADEVEELARRVEEESSFRVWLDKWRLVAGQHWMPEIKKALESVKCCMVFIGNKTPAGWFNEEIQRALDLQTKKKDFRVIAVLLPGANESSIDDFLALRTMIDFRKGLDNPKSFHELIRGIEGVPPGKGPELKPADEKVEIIKRQLRRIKELLDENLIDIELAREFRRPLIDSILNTEVFSK